MNKRHVLGVMLPGLLAPGLGQLAYAAGWVSRRGLVVGALYIGCAVALVAFRRTIPLVQTLVPALILLVAGLVVVGIVPIPEMASTSIALGALMIFLLIDLIDRRNHPNTTAPRGH